MAGNYYHIDYSNDDSSPQNKIEMFARILKSNKKLEDHALACGYKDDCKICPKLNLMTRMFIHYEKNTNTKLEIEKLLDDEGVEEVIFKDNLFRIINEY